MKRFCMIFIILLLLLQGCTPADKGDFDVVETTYAPAPTATATPVPRDELTVDEGVYTIAWMTDTQHYSKKFPDIYANMTEFLAENRARTDLRYIVHTGDIAHNSDDEAQYIAADAAMDNLEGIPYGVLAGNHDVNGGSVLYQQYFGESRFAGKVYYGESFENNLAHYDLISAGGTDYIFVYLSYKPSNEMIKWANSVFAEHADRVGVLAVHEYFDTDSTLTEEGEKLFEKVVAKNPNIYMVLCGHRYTVNCIEAAFDDDKDGAPDRTVYQMIANYQAAGDMGGEGYMRFMQVDNAEGVIRMYTYSPYTEDFVYFDEEEHAAEKYAADPANEEFVIPIPWR